MSGVTFVRYYPAKWRSGCRYMSLPQEGLYIRMCAYIYETGKRIPYNNSAAAKLMGVHTNAYAKIRDELEKLGVLTKSDDGWTIQRVEIELANARAAQTKKADVGASRGSDGEEHQDGGTTLAEQGAVQHTIEDTPDNTPDNTPQVFSDLPLEINGRKNDLILMTQETITPLPPKGDLTVEEKSNGPIRGEMPTYGYVSQEIVFTETGIELRGAQLKRWLSEFEGDEKAMRLALAEAHAEHNPKGRYAIERTVAKVLARKAADAHQRSKNYAKAVETNAARAKPSEQPRFKVKWNDLYEEATS
jgi:uncharacterized protein YdaU (DUF1376 family)